jgi:quercetin dioxygenase-like cupin family protein
LTGVAVAFVLGIASALVVVVADSPSMDPVLAAPDAFNERLHTAKARVLEYTSKPGDKEPMHSHPAGILIVLNGGKYRSIAPDGKVTDTDYKTGAVVWREAVTHSGENIGTTELRAYLIELE